MRKRSFFLKAAAATAALSIGMIAASADAQSYNVAFATGLTGGNQFNAAADNSFQAATGNRFVGATFTYTGPLSFNVGQNGSTTFNNDLNSAFFSGGTVSNYTAYGNFNGGSLTLGGTSNVDFTNLSTFLASTGSRSDFQLGSILYFDLGTLGGGTTLTIAHDDGASVYQGSTRIGTTVAGPTVLVTDSVRLPGTAHTGLFYGRENGAPSTLNVTMAAVPEPATWGMMILGFGMVGFAMRRRVRASEVRFTDRINRIAAGDLA